MSKNKKDLKIFIKAFLQLNQQWIDRELKKEADRRAENDKRVDKITDVVLATLNSLVNTYTNNRIPPIPTITREIRANRPDNDEIRVDDEEDRTSFAEDFTRAVLKAANDEKTNQIDDILSKMDKDLDNSADKVKDES